MDTYALCAMLLLTTNDWTVRNATINHPLWRSEILRHALTCQVIDGEEASFDSGTVYDLHEAYVLRRSPDYIYWGMAGAFPDVPTLRLFMEANDNYVNRLRQLAAFDPKQARLCELIIEECQVLWNGHSILCDACWHYRIGNHKSLWHRLYISRQLMEANEKLGGNMHLGIIWSPLPLHRLHAE